MRRGHGIITRTGGYARSGLRRRQVITVRAMQRFSPHSDEAEAVVHRSRFSVRGGASGHASSDTVRSIARMSVAVHGFSPVPGWSRSTRRRPCRESCTVGAGVGLRRAASPMRNRRERDRKLACDHDCLVALRRRVGDFVPASAVIFEIFVNKARGWIVGCGRDPRARHCHPGSQLGAVSLSRHREPRVRRPARVVAWLRRPVEEKQARTVDKVRSAASSGWIALMGADAAGAQPGLFIPIALKTNAETDPSHGTLLRPLGDLHGRLASPARGRAHPVALGPRVGRTYPRRRSAPELHHVGEVAFRPECCGHSGREARGPHAGRAGCPARPAPR
jgi:hypothetical protein